MSFYQKEKVKRALGVHTVVALACAWVLYLICLSGTLAVVVEWIERIEQPHVPEFLTVNPDAPARAIEQLQDTLGYSPKSIYVVLPNDILPRMHVSADGNEWWLSANGEFNEKVVDGLAGFIRSLHTHLHLPEQLGLILVSCFGVMMLLLIFSGIWSHPSILKDAFKWRRDGERLEQVDLHNRLSVWGLPFHVMFGLTGAIFGLVSVLVFIASQLFYSGDQDAVVAEVYGHDPVIEKANSTFNIALGLKQLSIIAPEATPIYIVAQNAGTDMASYEIAATKPRRFSYSEIYHFSAAGKFLGAQGLTDGPIARQWIYSVYRIHYGHFGGWLTRIIYVFLGIALCIICTSGMKSYFLRTQTSQSLQIIWGSFVWGAVLGIIAAGVAAWLSLSTLDGFIGGLVLSLCMGVVRVRFKSWMADQCIMQ